jgi:hypothetical protein
MDAQLIAAIFNLGRLDPLNASTLSIPLSLIGAGKWPPPNTESRGLSKEDSRLGYSVDPSIVIAAQDSSEFNP